MSKGIQSAVGFAVDLACDCRAVVNGAIVDWRSRRKALWRNSFVLAILAPLFPHATLAQTGEYVIVAAHVDKVMDPKSLADTLQECMNNASCKGLLKETVTSFGVPEGAYDVTAALMPPPEYKGEDSQFSFELPKGYLYCHSTIATNSVVPLEGSRASLMGVTSFPRGIGVYTWTPQRRPGEGRSWVDAYFTIVGVAEEYAERDYEKGACKRPGKTLTSCRGNGTGNDGRPACGVVID
jgi:hypothetical protein